MNKKLLLLALVAAVVLAGITKNGKLGVGAGAFAVVVLFIVSQLHAVSKTKRIKDISELDYAFSTSSISVRVCIGYTVFICCKAEKSPVVRYRL